MSSTPLLIILVKEDSRTVTWVRAFAFLISSCVGSRKVQMLMNLPTSLDQWSFSSCVCSAASSKAAQDPSKKNYRPQVDEKEGEGGSNTHRNLSSYRRPTDTFTECSNIVHPDLTRGCSSVHRLSWCISRNPRKRFLRRLDESATLSLPKS